MKLRFHIIFFAFAVVFSISVSSCKRNGIECEDYVHNCDAINDSVLNALPYDSGKVKEFENGSTMLTLSIFEKTEGDQKSLEPCTPGTLFPGCSCEGWCTNTAKFSGSFNQNTTKADSSFSIEFEENLRFLDMDTSIHYIVTIDLCGFPTYIDYRNPNNDSLIFDSIINGTFYPKLVFKFRDTNELDSGDVWNLYYSEESGIVSFQTYLSRSPYLLKP